MRYISWLETSWNAVWSENMSLAVMGISDVERSNLPKEECESVQIPLIEMLIPHLNSRSHKHSKILQ